MLDLLTLTATEAQHLLETGQTTSVQLVEAYLSQIAKHNKSGLHLNALISIAPRGQVLAAARDLDAERAQRKTRGPLHGIPLVIKDVFTTHPELGMSTTAGAPCFASASAKRTAPVVQHLIEGCGILVLGKANLTEFCGLKYDGLTPGYSPMGGQTQSPYIFDGLAPSEKLIGHSSIGGSSSGSASAVAAGFAPLSVGTECCGSVITPANRGGLYALKCGLDAVDVAGVFHYTDCSDFVGAMAKSAEDLGLLTAALMQRPERFDDVGGGFQGLRVGFLDVREWIIPEEICEWPDGTKEQIGAAYNDAMKRLSNHGAQVLENVQLSNAADLFEWNGKSMLYEIATYQLSQSNMQAFIDEFDDCGVRSVEGMVQYNKDHADVCLPPEHPHQTQLEELLTNKTTEADCQTMIAEMRRRGHAELDRLLERVDVVVALGDSPLCRYTSATGYPIACMPLGTVKYSVENERPFGICATAGRGQEGLLLRFAAAFEAAFPPRPRPRPLMTG